MSEGSPSPRCDIYNDGSYVGRHPSLHSEDSEYKFSYIEKLLDALDLRGTVRILDVGGGAGIIGFLVCKYFLGKGMDVVFSSLDLSEQMLSVQKRNNPYLKEAFPGSPEDFSGGPFDLALMIDVIEHVPHMERAARRISELSRYVIYNIPTEKNAADLLKNVYFKGKFYKLQTESLGHIHFFSYRSSLCFVRKYHRIIGHIFPDYCGHILETDSGDYIEQKRNRLRLLELLVSRFIYRHFRFAAPYLIEGSHFILGASATGGKTGSGAGGR